MAPAVEKAYAEALSADPQLKDTTELKTQIALVRYGAGEIQAEAAE